MKIDWNIAPDATHYDKRKGCVPAFMRKAADGSGWEFRQTSGRWMYYSTLTDEQVAKLKVRPAPWNGEGRPPVRTVCEHRTGPGMSWSSATVLAYGEKKVFYRDRDGHEWSRPYDEIEFRPIRTPEQIAMADRANRIQEALVEVKGCRSFPGDIVRGNITRSVVEAMIDAGYRKQVKP